MTLLEKINWTELKIVQADYFSFNIVFPASLRIQQKFDLLEEFDSGTQCWKKQTNKQTKSKRWLSCIKRQTLVFWLFRKVTLKYVFLKPFYSENIVYGLHLMITKLTKWKVNLV